MAQGSLKLAKAAPKGGRAKANNAVRLRKGSTFVVTPTPALLSALSVSLPRAATTMFTVP